MCLMTAAVHLVSAGVCVQSRLLQAKAEHEAELHALCGATEAAQSSFDQLYVEYTQLLASHHVLETENHRYKVDRGGLGCVGSLIDPLREW